ncbi:DUF6089 family protein [Cesiribacter sp. SM1]|uniref:DUF6089 family protein n=1 Tax=Cesiribacter sp. SM1 TaxID=2861196 RepID=UPI001CD698E8|nr:DUF6089 family protein [Cesiribacter sp. SM1]
MKYRIFTFLTCLLVSVGTIAEAQIEGGDLLTDALSQYKLRNRHGVFSYNLGVGVSSYFGDLKDSRTDLWVKPSIQLGVQYRAGDHLHFRSEVTWYRISGADSLNDVETGIYARNLSFRADNFEWNVVALYQFFNKFSRTNSVTLNPYVFAGIGLTSNNPNAYYNGQWHNLRRLETEGVSYSPVALVVPFGVGLAYHVNRNWDISVEWGYRVSFTDYLDDVSTTFRGVENFDDPLARALSDRRPEMGLPPKEAGSKRGNTGVNDWYLITGLKVTYMPFLRIKNPKHR